MELSPLKKYFPWRTNTSEMRWNVLLMCKLLFILLLLNGFWPKIQDPFLPFLAILDHFNEVPGTYALANKILFLTSGLFLLFNIKVRTMSGILGLTILVILLGSKPIFRNHILICGCAFFLAALNKKDEDPYLLYFQLGLVYIGATLNKMYQLDWWNGVYMHNWMVNVLDSEAYLWVTKDAQNLFFAKGLSWFSMLLEIIVGIFLFLKNFRRYAIYLILFFHLILFTVTKERFGHFLDDILIFLIAFINKASIPQTILVNQRWNSAMKLIKSVFDWDGIFKIKNIPSKNGSIEIQNSNRTFTNVEALKHLLFSSSGFFYLLFFADLVLRFVFNQPVQHIVQVTLYWSLFFLFAIRWKPKTTVSTYSYQN